MLAAASSLELPDSLAGLAWLAPIECLELAKTWPGWLRKVVADGRSYCLLPVRRKVTRLKIIVKTILDDDLVCTALVPSKKIVIC